MHWNVITPLYELLKKTLVLQGKEFNGERANGNPSALAGLALKIKRDTILIYRNQVIAPRYRRKNLKKFR